MRVTDSDEVLAYWFGQAAVDPAAVAAQYALWFRGGAEVDAAIAARFGATIEAAARGALASWKATPRGTLAYILVCDQFPRNVWRGTARAYSLDGFALAAARDALGGGQYASLAPVERAFVLMPFEHSESLDDQRTCVAEFSALVRDAAGPWQAQMAGFLDYSRQHLALIERFGRFPHRNRLLGRTSTAAEVAFLEGGGAVFGQG
ncbi:MAG: hypothetical protein NAOJABEB_02198 [Steroidobacteraceae bacterium]|nr:hypothetical protein [Steroidobacteraceae bacterium]